MADTFKMTRPRRPMIIDVDLGCRFMDGKADHQTAGLMPEHLIALEIHDVALWEPSRVEPIIDILAKWGYNALVLHQNDLLDCCTQLDLTANYGVADLRLKKVRNNTAWLDHLCRRLAKVGARLFLEIKEPSFHDYAVEMFPDLLGPDGRPDPRHQAWATFCRRKTEDLLARVPDLGGLIITLSSPESRVSLPDYLAETGNDADIADWFDRMIAAFREPLASMGKALYIRDFSYTADFQSDVIAAVNRCHGSVGASVKITAHDYFPEFPENPAAAMVKAPLVFEFEAFGEHTGWGVIPNCRVGEYCRRMAGYRARDASGLLMRTSWEAITGANALDGLSAVNVFALPRLLDGDRDPAALVQEWLQDTYGIAGDQGAKVADLMLRSWHVPAAAYWDGHVFPRHSCLPSTWQEGWLSMQTSGMGRRDRDLAIDPDDPALTEAARTKLFAATDDAVTLATALAEEAEAIRPSMPDDLAAHLSTFAWLPPFARQFELATKATLYAARGSGDDLHQITALRSRLLQLAEDVTQRLAAEPDLPHHHRVLFDPDQIRLFAGSLSLP